MLRRGNSGIIRDQRGAAMAEYAPLLIIIALLVMFSVAFIGPWVSEQVIDASVPLDDGACPPNWTLTAKIPDKNGNDKVNKNGDDLVCVKKGIPGNGNTGTGKNVKDNNRGPGSQPSA